MTHQAVDNILENYPLEESSIIAILQELQERENYLPEKDLEYIAEKLGIPLTRVYRIATFYNAFSLKPRGRFPISVCMGTACHVHGSSNVLDRLKTVLEIDEGEVTPDGLFSIETVNCLGACALGPIIMIGEEFHGQMSPDKVDSVLNIYRKKVKG